MNINLWGKSLLVALAMGWLSGIVIDNSLWAQTPSPTPFSFTVVVLPDTQLYSQSYPEIFTNQTQWIVDNKEALNIAFVIHVGDIVQSYESSDTEWSNASTSMAVLDGQVPYLVIPGNHDGYPNVAYTKFNQYFPVSRFENQTYYGGHYPPEGNQNNYGFFSSGGEDFLVLGMEYRPDEDTREWAEGIVGAHTDKTAILFTHSYLQPWDGWRSEEGQAIWNDVIKVHDNVVLVLCGHLSCTRYRTDYVFGSPVNQVVQDFSYCETVGENGGNGWLRYFVFQPENGKIQAKTYSPYLDEFWEDSDNEFEFNYPARSFIFLEGFDDFQNGARPAGWEFTNCDANEDSYEFIYGGTSPSLKLDATGDIVTTELFSHPEDLRFWAMGVGTDTASSLELAEYYNSTWHIFSSINNFSSTGATKGPFPLNENSSKLRFSYQKSAGAIAFDDVRISQGDVPPTTPTPEGYLTPTPTPSTTPSPVPSPSTTPSPITPTPSPTSMPTATPYGYETPSPSPTATAFVIKAVPPGDYNGDGTSDLAIFRPENGLWKIRGLSSVYFGTSEDIPVPQDYDGDGAWDLAYFRGSYGIWKIRGVTRIYFGSSNDQMVPGDYDGDGTVEPAYFRPSNALWNVRNLTRVYFGTSTDEPIPGDYDGDGAVDPAFFRDSNGLWKVRNFTSIYFGAASDTLIPGDYNGDGTVDFAFFRATSGLWKVKDLTKVYFGTSEDTVIPGDYDGDGTTDYGYFRPSSTLWKAKDVTRVYFGLSDDSQISNPY